MSRILETVFDPGSIHMDALFTHAGMIVVVHLTLLFPCIRVKINECLDLFQLHFGI